MTPLPAEFHLTAAEPIRLPDGTVVRLPKAGLTLPRWQGAPLTNSGASWQRKPLVAVLDQPMFAELAVQVLLVAAGWEARWIGTYGVGLVPKYLTEWQDAALSRQVSVPITDFAVQAQLAAIAATTTAAGYAGCWDVVAWCGTELLFVEVKRAAGRDHLQLTQVAWLDAAIRQGLTAQQFLLVEWDFPS